ncbi:MAG: zinc-dependent alcohol dehydrogenase family protein [Candidatus Binataceae bacterium]
MKAAVLEEIRKPLAVKDMPDPEGAPDAVILRVEANGVCRSDWHFWMGDWTWVGLTPILPAVLGHEFCGVVEETGRDVKNFKRGDRVVVPFSQGEGSCEYCRSGNSHLCMDPPVPGRTYSGGFGHYVAAPCADVNVVRLIDGIGFVEAASMGCRFMTAFHGIVDRAQVKPGEWVAVHGCGGVGLSALHIASAMGAQTIGVDLDDSKLDLAKKVGALHVVNAKKTNPVEAVHEITKGGAQVAVDALGVAATCRNSVMSLRKQGRHLQIGLTTAAEKGEVTLPIDMIVGMELQFMGTFGMPASRYPRLLDMVAARKLNPQLMVTGTCNLEGINKVFGEMSNFQNVGMTVLNNFE